MIIFNNIARTENSAPKQIKEEVIKGISTENVRKIGALPGGRPTSENPATIESTIFKLKQSPFDQGQIRESGQAPLSRGVWINSKAIQAAFINARTIMEGMETLLNNMNAATENYWDLKLFYDEEQQLFRIVDDNLRTTDNTISQIYEFNKRLSSIDGDTIGPDVLDIQIQTDYPKIFFSQLAISGINNLSSSPIRKEKDFRDNTSVRDIFTVKVDTVPTQAPEIIRNVPREEFRSFITTLFGSQVTVYGDFFNSTIDGLDTAFASGISSELQTIIRDVFANNTLLTRSQAQGFKQRLDKEAERGNLDQAQSAIISQIFLRRAEAIIRRDKQNELANLDLALQDAKDKEYINPGLIFNSARGARQVIRKKIEEDRDRRIADLRTAVASVEQTQAVKEQTEREKQEAQTLRGVGGR
jgi:hypothetical protein